MGFFPLRHQSLHSDMRNLFNIPEFPRTIINKHQLCLCLYPLAAINSLISLSFSSIQVYPCGNMGYYIYIYFLALSVKRA